MLSWFLGDKINNKNKTMGAAKIIVRKAPLKAIKSKTSLVINPFLPAKPITVITRQATKPIG